MERLPKDVLKTVLEYFHESPNAFILRQVCKKWKNLIPSTDTWAIPIIEYNTKHGHLGVLKWLYLFFPNSILECELSECAADASDLAILKWAYSIGHDLHEGVFAKAAGAGSIATLEWLKDQKCPYNFSLWESTVFNGQLQTLRWLQGNNFDCYSAPRCLRAAVFSKNLEMLKMLALDIDTSNLLDEAIQYGTEEMVEYLLDNGATWTPWSFENAAIVGNLDLFVQAFPHRSGSAYSKAAEKGCFEILEWMYNNGFQVIEHDAVSRAATGGHFEIVQWLVARNATYDHAATNGAAKSGNLVLLQWLVEKGCAINFREILNIASRNGRLPILEWLWTYYTQSVSQHSNKITYWASESGEVRILEWAKDKGFEFPSEISVLAAMHAHLPVLQYLKENNFPIDSKVCQHAARSGNIRVLQWLMKNGFTATPEAAQLAARCGHLVELKFLKRKEIWSSEVIHLAKKKGHLRIVRWLEQSNYV